MSREAEFINASKLTPAMANMIGAMLNAQKMINRNLDDILKPMGLTYPRFEILYLLSEVPEGAVTMMQIGKMLGRHSTTIGSLIDRLSAAGLVTRSVNSEDRREVLVAITVQGNDVSLAASRALAQISLKDRSLLRRISEDLEQFRLSTDSVLSKQLIARGMRSNLQ